MPDYKDIYNDVISSNPLYKLAQNSPGFRIVLQSEETLIHLSGKSLDVGCGPAFAVEYLSGHQFNFETYGVDISNEAIELARQRLNGKDKIGQRLRVINSQQLPFDDDQFSLVTTFDVLEHLDEEDIVATLKEIDRVMIPGGTFLGAVSCRKAGWNDKFGDNLHRTVQGTDFWIDQVAPDRAIYDGQRQQFILWKRKPDDGSPLFSV